MDLPALTLARVRAHAVALDAVASLDRALRTGASAAALHAYAQQVTDAIGALGMVETRLADEAALVVGEEGVMGDA